MEFMLLGEDFDAQRALTAGMVNCSAASKRSIPASCRREQEESYAQAWASMKDFTTSTQPGTELASVFVGALGREGPERPFPRSSAPAFRGHIKCYTEQKASGERALATLTDLFVPLRATNFFNERDTWASNLVKTALRAAKPLARNARPLRF